jgi:hypothetical protein
MWWKPPSGWPRRCPNRLEDSPRQVGIEEVGVEEVGIEQVGSGFGIEQVGSGFGRRDHDGRGVGR